MATRKNKDSERIYRIGGSDPRTGMERLAGLVGRAISPDKKQNRRYDDSPERMASNRRATEKRLEEERKRRRKR